MRGKKFFEEWLFLGRNRTVIAKDFKASLFRKKMKTKKKIGTITIGKKIKEEFEPDFEKKIRR